MIVIIDYGMGNVGSIYNMLRCNGTECIVSSKVDDIETADRLILPGVGTFDSGMKNLKTFGLIEVLNKKVTEDGIPILGICLGMQLFTKKSEEGTVDGLGWIDARTVRFKFDAHSSSLKIPHMGWDTANVQKPGVLFNDMPEKSRFYFVHSYYVVCSDKSDILTTTNYGYEFTSSFQRDNIVGVQFHPEKSHKFGMRFMKNFSEVFCCRGAELSPAC